MESHLKLQLKDHSTEGIVDSFLTLSRQQSPNMITDPEVVSSFHRHKIFSQNCIWTPKKQLFAPTTPKSNNTNNINNPLAIHNDSHLFDNALQKLQTLRTHISKTFSYDDYVKLKKQNQSLKTKIAHLSEQIQALNKKLQYKNELVSQKGIFAAKVTFDKAKQQYLRKSIEIEARVTNLIDKLSNNVDRLEMSLVKSIVRQKQPTPIRDYQVGRFFLEHTRNQWIQDNINTTVAEFVTQPVRNLDVKSRNDWYRSSRTGGRSNNHYAFDQQGSLDESYTRGLGNNKQLNALEVGQSFMEILDRLESRP